MRREPKRARPERAISSAISRRPGRVRSSGGVVDDRTSSEPRSTLFLDAVDPDAPARVAPPRLAVAPSVPLFTAAAIAIVVLKGVLLRAVFPLGLAMTGAFVLVRAHVGVWLSAARRAWGSWPRGPSPEDVPQSAARRGLELAGDDLSFRSAGGSQALLSTAAEFGVTLLATPGRDRAVALLTSGSGTFYVGANFDGDARRDAAHVLDHATTVGGDDAGLASIAPDGAPLLISSTDLVALLEALAARAPNCLDRFILTDARGTALRLDDHTLCAGTHRIELDAPLEWRAIIFQEAFGQAVAVYQGTWVRQGSSELVLVCLLPGLGTAIFTDVDLAGLDRVQGQPSTAPLGTLLRDIRLMQATPTLPPPTDQRVAIDRLFMLPVRCALDRAPRASQQPSRARV